MCCIQVDWSEELIANMGRELPHISSALYFSSTWNSDEFILTERCTNLLFRYITFSIILSAPPSPLSTALPAPWCMLPTKPCHVSHPSNHRHDLGVNKNCSRNRCYSQNSVWCLFYRRSPSGVTAYRPLEGHRFIVVCPVDSNPQPNSTRYPTVQRAALSHNSCAVTSTNTTR